MKPLTKAQKRTLTLMRLGGNGETVYRIGPEYQICLALNRRGLAAIAHTDADSTEFTLTPLGCERADKLIQKQKVQS